MHRTVVAAMGIVVVGCWVGVPQATADNPVCTATFCSFYSPSRNISCELDYQRGSGIPDETYCQTETPPQSGAYDHRRDIQDLHRQFVSRQRRPRHSGARLRPNRRGGPV